jgi:hypothetical protein
LAADAMRTRRARGSGPVAKQEKAKKVRRIVCEQAEIYWSRHPIYRGDAKTTSANIASAVNEMLRAQGLLPTHKDRLSATTLASHIREGFRGK